MTVTAAQFRLDFPEFADTAAFPDTQVTFWLNAAALFMSAERWGDCLDFGTELYIAHNLTLARQNQIAVAKGGVPGIASGRTQSKAVDKVSVSYDTGSVTIDGAGAWNMTTYGVQFYQLLLMFGAGGVQL
ncbi:DUF4054 domain-containing protein [Labrys neptuniae]